MIVTETLAKLVEIDSVSSRSNASIANYLAARCEATGLRTRFLASTDEYGIEKINLIALAGGEFTDTTKVELALVGHMDTVPYDPSWKDATVLTERAGKLYGRGACDTKGFIAGALSAIESVDLKRLRRPVALIFTADEEIGGLGAKRLAEMRALHARFAIVGEPTSLRPIRAGKGYCFAEITVHGREVHSAYPSLGASAIFPAARIISRIERIAEQLKAEQHAAFDPPYTTINLGLISGGSARNIVPGECRFTLEWRPIPGQQPSRVFDLLTQAIESERQHEPGFDCEVNAATPHDGFETSASSQLVRLLETSTRQEAGTVPFGTEAPMFVELGAEAVVFGPGDIHVAHRNDEFVPINELHQCVEILRDAIESSCC